MRVELGLTGSHLGCEHGVCGACSVRVDGVVVRGCLMLAAQADGADVVTIEGLSDTGEIADLQVSAHLLILRDGSAQQFVALDRRAWHAGQSSFCGRERCNDFSIGIELEGSDDTPFSDAQYQRLDQLTQRIRRLFPAITPERIVGHSDIAPARKTDPGPCFDWDRYHTLLARQDSRGPQISDS